MTQEQIQKRNRFDDAVEIQGGACNPIAITNAIVRMMQEVSAEGGDHNTITNDPAIRLAVHQLAYLCGTPSFDRDTMQTYFDAMAECKAKAGLARNRE